MIVLSLWKGEIDPKARLTMRQVIADVAEKHGVTVAQLQGSSRERSLSYARQEAMYEARRITQKSLPLIGQYLNRDHTTILHGVRAHAARIGA